MTTRRILQTGNRLRSGVLREKANLPHHAAALPMLLYLFSLGVQPEFFFHVNHDSSPPHTRAEAPASRVPTIPLDYSVSKPKDSSEARRNEKREEAKKAS